MICEQQNHLWLGRFSVALMKLREGTSLPAAVSRAVVAHEHLGDMVPEEAAAIEARVLLRRTKPAVTRQTTRAVARVAFRPAR
jgi:hypothetical protein